MTSARDGRPTLNELLSGRREPTPAPAPRAVTPPPEGCTAYGMAALEAELADLGAAQEGERNDTLCRTAFSCWQLVDTGDLLPEVVREAFTDVAHSIGLDATEVTATIESARKGAARFPRAPREELATLVVREDGSMSDADVEAATTSERQRTSWWPVDVTGWVTGSAEPSPPPAFLHRADGINLLYPGRVNGLIGEPESGKSWVSLLAVLQALAAGTAVTFLDFEDTAAGIIARLQQMGASTASLLERFSYVAPETSLDLVAAGDLSEHLALTEPGLVVMDGVNAAMSLMGLDLLDNKDATVFHQRLMAPVASRGACVVYVDHVPKKTDGETRYAIGAQAKKAMTSGAALTVSVRQPFGVGQHGTMALTVAKDRDGQVRGICPDAKTVGLFHLDSKAEGVTRAWIEPPAGTTGFLPTAVMERVSLLLEAAAGPLPQRSVEQAVGGKREIARAALSELARGGFTRFEHGPRNSLLHVSVKPYREPPL